MSGERAIGAWQHMRAELGRMRARVLQYQPFIVVHTPDSDRWEFVPPDETTLPPETRALLGQIDAQIAVLDAHLAQAWTRHDTYGPAHAVT